MTESPRRGSYAFTLPIEVCLRDLDGLGHVNNAVYLTYLETARNRYVLDLLGRKGLAGFDFILAQTTINFRAAASLHDTLNVCLRPTRVGTSSWAMEYEIRDVATDQLMIDASSVQVSYNYATDQSEPVSEAFRRLLEAECKRCGV